MVVLESERLLTVNEVHEYLPCSLPHIYALIRSNKVPAMRLGGKIFIREAVLKKILTDGTVSYHGIKPGIPTEGVQGNG
jgi:excisionase family DNA binding protein